MLVFSVSMQFHAVERSVSNLALARPSTGLRAFSTCAKLNLHGEAVYRAHTVFPPPPRYYSIYCIVFYVRAAAARQINWKVKASSRPIPQRFNERKFIWHANSTARYSEQCISLHNKPSQHSQFTLFYYYYLLIFINASEKTTIIIKLNENGFRIL